MYQHMLCYAMLSCFSCVWLCATPQTAAHQAPPSLGFSRQEYWSGLPFPSPMHEREKWKWNRCRVRLLATPWTAAYQAPLSMGFSRQEYWSRVPLSSPIYISAYFKQLLVLANNNLFIKTEKVKRSQKACLLQNQKRISSWSEIKYSEASSQ